MKANEAPEKIYITNYDIEALPKDEQLSERWYEVSTQDTDIEYTRTDAFIEKACEYAAKHFLVMDREIDNFKNYMKGKERRII